MNHMLVWLLTLLFSLSSPAVEGNAAFWRSSLAAGTGPETFEILDGVGPMAEANRYQFSSKETEALSGLSYYGFRFYDPGLQRWINPDPLGERFDGNLYRFNYQNPLSYVDPDGLAPQMVGFNYDLNTGGVSPQYVDQRFGQGYGMGLHGPLRSGAPGMMTGSIVPGVGEGMDLWVLGDPDAKWWEKSLAGASLGANALTGGLLPNIGGLLKAGKTMCKKVAGAAGDSAFQRMLKAGEALDKGDLTKAGRALQKHGSRPGSVFPSATGNPAAINQQGQQVLQDILSSQNQTIKPNRYGGRDIFDAGTGRGVRYDGSGNMMGFLEP